jgi:hypothetical protein
VFNVPVTTSGTLFREWPDKVVRGALVCCTSREIVEAAAGIREEDALNSNTTTTVMIKQGRSRRPRFIRHLKRR